MEHTQNPDLGIAAGLEVTPGSLGIVDYAMLAADTLRHAVATAARFGHILSDSWQPRFERVREQIFLELSPGTRNLPRAAGDFGVCAFYSSQLRGQLDERVHEAWFAHPRPDDIRAYESAFAGIRLVFNAPAYGFLLPPHTLDSPRPSRDSMLHSMVCAHASFLQDRVERTGGFAERVRDLIFATLTSAERLTVPRIGYILHVSSRTLNRRLREEGTTFLKERDLVVSDLAKEYLKKPRLEVREIAALLGFGHVQTFHRAFKRWTGLTPVEYRMRIRRK